MNNYGVIKMYNVIYSDIPDLDVFVASVGTGGTITGISKHLKEKIKGIKTVAVEPKNSQVLSGGKPGPHKIQGIGAGFVPKTLDTSIYDKVVTAVEEDAYKAARDMGKREGILVGISSGAALIATHSMTTRHNARLKAFVVIY